MPESDSAKAQNTSYLPEHGQRRKYLFVASTGGHLAELYRFAARMNASVDSLWVTSRTPQSESLLDGRRVVFLPYVGGRDPIGVIEIACRASRILRRESFDVAISTGSAFTIGVFLAAAWKGVPRIFIESVSRVDGPSLTGRIICLLKLARLRSQYRWPGTRWQPHPSVLAQFSSERRLTVEPQALKIFVTVGTFRRFRFDSLIDAVLSTGLTSSTTTWQLGATDRDDLDGTTSLELDSVTFERAIRDADVVVTHAGTGTILSLLESGIYPVVVPRRKWRGEHVDDHQTEIAALLKDLDLARVVESGDLTAEDLLHAAAMTVRLMPGIQFTS